MKKLLQLNCKRWLILAVFLLLTSFPTAEAAAKRYYEDQSSIALREMRATLEDLRHEVNNHESEIKTYENKINNLETIIDTFRQQSNETAAAHKDALQDSSSTLETKINSLETTTKGLVADLKQLKNHANETVSALALYKQKLGDLEKILEIQNQNLDSLQASMKSFADILQVKNSSSIASSDKTYKVSVGDSLEKIARRQHTTIQSIKELNGLTNDRIIVGQTLKIP